MVANMIKAKVLAGVVLSWDAPMKIQPIPAIAYKVRRDRGPHSGGRLNGYG